MQEPMRRIQLRVIVVAAIGSLCFSLLGFGISPPTLGFANAPETPRVGYPPSLRMGDKLFREGIRLYEMGIHQHEKALSYFNQALLVYRLNFWRAQEADTLFMLGLVYDSLSRPIQARDAYSQALSLYVELDDDDGKASVLNNLGGVYSELAQYDQAREMRTRALALRRKLKEPISEAGVLLNLGNVYLGLGDPIFARQLYEQALIRYRKLQDRWGEHDALNNLATVHHSLGQHTKALELLQQELDFVLGQSFRFGIPENRSIIQEAAGILYSLGDVYFAVSSYEAARAAYIQAFSFFQGTHPEGEAIALSRLGGVNLALGQPVIALQFYTHAYQMAHRLAWSPGLWSAAFGRGRALERLGRAGAEENYRAAIRIIEKMRGGVGRAEHRAEFFADKVAPYDGLTSSLIRQAVRGNKAASAEAFRVAESGRARVLLDLLSEARARGIGGIAPELVVREAGLRGELVALEERFRREMSKPQMQQNRFLLDMVTRRRLELEQALGDIQQELIGRYPGYAELVQPTVADAVAVQRILRPKEVLVKYFIGEDLSAAWVISKKAVRLHTLPLDAQNAEAVVRNQRKQLEAPKAFDLTAASQLYTALMTPIEQDLQHAETVFIVPDGPLQYLAFEALVHSVRFRDTKEAVRLKDRLELHSGLEVTYLADRYTIAYLQSASILACLRGGRCGQAGPRPQKDFVVFADPVYGIDEVKAAGAGSNRGAVEIHRSLQAPRAGFGRFNFPRLKFTEEEAKSIGPLFGATAANGGLNVRLQAQETRVKELDLSQFRYVHFATHGILGDEVAGAWQQPSLVLSLHGDSKNDGFLQMDEIFNLRLNADLVTLSACRTGLGQALRGEGLLGLTRAFMYAGTPSVAVSLWLVNDRATAHLMEAFYRNLKDGQPKAVALNSARRDLRRWVYRDEILGTIGHEHPYYWTSFILVGEPR